MKGVPEGVGCKFGLGGVVSIGLVYDYSVCHLHYAAFDSLQFIAGAGQLYE